MAAIQKTGKVQRVTKVTLQMKKLDIKPLEEAYNQIK